jgi:hypothetical protein
MRELIEVDSIDGGHCQQHQFESNISLIYFMLYYY